jgi:hemerythrin-like domain-containing protein
MALRLAKPRPRNADAISLLTQDHRNVKRLLKELESTTERAAGRRETLVKEIEAELTLHTRVEEDIFYPAYKDAARKSDAHLYYEAVEEHHLVDIVLPELKSSRVDSEEFAAKAKVLKDLIEHHAGEEEKQMFPRARKVMSGQELRDLGQQIQIRKQEFRKNLAA